MRVIGLALALLVGIGACAPLRQRPLTVLEPVAPVFTNTQLIASDGAQLGLQHWQPEGVEPWVVLVALHGMNDYSGAFALPGPYWAQRGVAVYAIDLRGFGKSPNRGVWPALPLLRQDIRDAVSAARAAHPGVPVAVLGLSMGAAAAMDVETSGQPTGAHGLILVSPAVWGWSQMPWAYSAALRLAALTAPGARLEPPKSVIAQVTPSDNLALLRRMGRDDNLLFETRTDALLGLVNLMQRASDAAEHVPPGTLYLLGARDEIIPPAVAERAAARLPPSVHVLRYANGYHLLLGDGQAETVWRDILAHLAGPSVPLRSVNSR